MASNNLTRFYITRYNSAVSKYNTDDHEESLQELRELLLDPELPRFFRLRANFTLADESDDWYLCEDYRLEAERVYREIRAIWPDGDAEHPKQEEKLRNIREGLDELAREQAEDNPRREEMAEPEASQATVAESGLDQPESSQLTNVSTAPSTEPERDVDEPMSSTDIESDDAGDVTEVAIPLRPSLFSPSAPRFAPATLSGPAQRSPKRPSPEKEDPVESPSKKKRRDVED